MLIDSSLLILTCPQEAEASQTAACFQTMSIVKPIGAPPSSGLVVVS